MIHGLLFWLEDWESLKFGPDQIRIWSLDQSCCPDLRCMLSGPPECVVRTTGE
jgi:hypothetical protein